MITIHSYAPLCFGGPVIFIVSLGEGGAVGGFFLGGGGKSHGFQEEWREAQLSPKNSKGRLWKIDRQLTDNEESVLEYEKALQGNQVNFLLWHNKNPPFSTGN